MTKRHFYNSHGFSLIEVIAVLAILVIISAVLMSRHETASANLTNQSEILQSHLRSIQSMAMAGSGITYIFGLKWDNTHYWAFQGVDPNASIVRLFDDPQVIGTDNKLSLVDKDISISAAINTVAFDGKTVFFDSRGIPYSEYTDETNNTPLAGDLSITVTPRSAGSSTKSFTLTQHTGFIQ